MTRRLVIALGGNALGNTPDEQLELIKGTASVIADLVALGNEVIVTHGNGPQVGMIKVATDVSAAGGGGTPIIPFPECGAMSQGYIGYHLQQALSNEFAQRGLAKMPASVVTQVVVDPEDPAFAKPTKPVGAFLSEEEAKKRAAATGDTYVEDSGRGWRWVVPSPLPKRIVEGSVIEQLVASGVVTIAAGGGGVPVVERDGALYGVASVIDKDRTAALLAAQVGADTLVILTAIEGAMVNFRQPDERMLREITVEEAKGYIADQQFAAGSMLPKVEACLSFVEEGEGRTAIITSLEKAKEALSGTTGTVIR